MPFLGMRGTGDWVENQRPENWRQKILHLYPNGAAPLTAIMSMIGNESSSDPHFHWWTKNLPNQRSSIVGVFTDAALTTAYVNSGVAGDVLYLQMSEDEIDKYNTSKTVLMRDSADLSVDVAAKVTARSKAGASSYLAVKLLEADDNSSSNTLAGADVCMIIGSANSEGAGRPDPVAYDPVELENYTQIFRNSLGMTRTAKLTQLRTGDHVKEAKRECLELHGIEMERGFIFGKPSQAVGDNGKPERTTAGVRHFITTNRYDFTADGGGTWLANGEAWFDEKLEQIFRFGSTEKLALCGSGALLGINRLAKEKGTFELTAKTQSYGVKVLEWLTAFGSLNLKTHPLFSYEPTLRNAIMVVEPALLKYRFITDTKYKPNIQDNDIDGEESEYLTEAGLEVHFEQAHGWIDNIGQNAG